MMRTIVLCGLILAVAAAPYLKDHAALPVEKRSQETIDFGNHQNGPRHKKSDAPVPVPDLIKEKDVEEITRNPEVDLQKTTKQTEEPHPVQQTKETESHKLGSPSDELKNTKPSNVVGALPVSQVGHVQSQSQKEMARQNYPTEIGRNQFYDRYYYDILRQAFRRKRRSLSQTRSSALKGSRRYKRDLGYRDLLNELDMDDEEAEKLADLLEPYVQTALKERYANDWYNSPFNDYNDNAGYEPYGDNRLSESDNSAVDENGDMDDIISSYLKSDRVEQPDMYPYILDDNDREKKSGFLSMMPGTKKKRFQYPYFNEPQTHWGAFLPANKRASSQDMYDQLYELASKLAKRDAYEAYLQELERYRK